MSAKGKKSIQKYAPLNSLEYRVSNELAFEKYGSSLLGNQLIKIGISKLESGKTVLGSQNKVEIYPGELRTLLGKGTGIYSELKKVSREILGKTIFIEENGNFIGFNQVNSTVYNNGVFVIEFNDIIAKHAIDRKNNFMVDKVPIAALFKSNASLQLYDMLKTSMYTGGFEINYYEMLFTLGFANIRNEKISGQLIKEKRNIDWKKLYDELPDNEKKYKEWKNFRRRVLDVAKKELDEKSDITFTYKKVRGTELVSFQVLKNENYRPVSNIRENMQSDDVQESAWQRITEKDDFNNFLVYMEEKGIDRVLLEDLFPPVERLELYSNWLRNE